MQFQISSELIEKIKFLVAEENNEELLLHLEDVHHADIAEIITELSLEEATYVVKLLDSQKTAEALMELEEGVRERILDTLSAKEIAEELEEMDTDDAADIISELSPERQQNVIAELVDEEHADNIVELLRYDEDSAGGLMAKELVKVQESWSVTGCMTEMREQAENVTRVHSIYVVDSKNKLKGRLSLKDLLTAPSHANISDVYIPQVDFVNVHTEGDEVARIMQKYDLEAIPVVDEMGRLVGRITIDDIVDFIKEEAEKDYQMASGISENVEADDSLLRLTRARLPWLVLGLFGGLGSVYIMKGFEEALEQFPILFFFTPLIAAMAGNVGVQSSAIIVQGLANDNLRGSLLQRLVKEVGLSLINGVALGILVILFGLIVGQDQLVSVTIAASLLSVIIVAALVGTFVPIILNKQGIDPAIATGPFITTSNDIFGIFLFFYISKLVLGF
ncbi:magnesium transporter [Salegentibacter mishustinae]|jgi:magnesium transporter|uniref:Magnesium transporter MgtE n=1 Tax=Salegentibacter mishustinae TaxID=270918 RepID=A0A0Q9ZDY5_9FLAO|nr:magnesium transporter [Salegentibacter mishustinae]KRG27422.1 magnesium transporter [Salegentibacter mishustinae]PNW20520.1 magnesium transporter [Salegentibacter mishustinae]PZX63326.1 magnesium transporter [Salegentibacter mishustinae]GGW93347.1 magnesium transporter MgtE [Salegentibacter mishustinae]